MPLRESVGMRSSRFQFVFRKQPVFFSGSCGRVSHTLFFAMWHASLEVRGMRADILERRASLTIPLFLIEERFL
jgi:hypothetical protein